MEGEMLDHFLEKLKSSARNFKAAGAGEVEELAIWYAFKTSMASNAVRQTSRDLWTRCVLGMAQLISDAYHTRSSVIAATESRDRYCWEMKRRVHRKDEFLWMWQSNAKIYFFCGGAFHSGKLCTARAAVCSYFGKIRHWWLIYLGKACRQ